MIEQFELEIVSTTLVASTYMMQIAGYLATCSGLLA